MKIDFFGENLDLDFSKLGQGTVAKFSAQRVLWGPRPTASSESPPSPKFWGKLGTTILGVSPPGGPGGNIWGPAPEQLGAVDSGHPALQNNPTLAPLAQTVWPQWPPQNMTIFENLSVHQYLGGPSSPPLTPGPTFFPDSQPRRVPHPSPGE